MIDNNNYELWLLRYAEGNLAAEERAAVELLLVGGGGVNVTVPWREKT